MTNRERISGVDTAWLRMEQPTNLMMIDGVMMLEGRPTLAVVKRLLRRRFLAYRRFRQCAVQDAAGAWWEDAVSFDIDRHVHQVSLPGRATRADHHVLASDARVALPYMPGRVRQGRAVLPA